jgi:hypothetical protein
MTEHMASRTLVKSPPELWAECSDAASLARHLDQFGEIRITRLEPETAVAWEGERARGTVRIEPSGWGTKVILTAVAAEEEASAFADAAGPVEAAHAAAAPEPLHEASEPPLVVAAPEAGDAEPVVVEAPEGSEAEPVVVEAPQAGEAEPVVVTDRPQTIKPATDLPARRRRFARLFGLFRGPRPQSGVPVGRVALDRPKPEPEFKPPAERAPAATETPATEASATDTPAADTPATVTPATGTPVTEAFPTEAPATEALPTHAPATEASATDTPATVTPATEAALTAALDSLGQAHHRPYSRA